MSAPLDPTDPTLVSQLDAQSYQQIIQYYLTQWGLESLIPTLTALGKDSSNTSDMIYLKLQQTPEWKQRFAGNEQRIKAGLPVLSPAEYLGLESSYHETLRQYGLPEGFYDDKASMDNWIGSDVSAQEVASRAAMAADLVYNSPPEAQQAWDQFYGGGQGGAIAAILDPTKAAPLVQQEVTAAQIGGAALHQGLSTDATRAMQFAQSGVTLDTARKAYSDIATRLPTDQALSNRFQNAATGQFGQTQEENATLLGNSDAIRQQATLYSEEKSQFMGHGGATADSGNSGDNY